MRSFVFPLEKVLAFRKKQWEAECAALEALQSSEAQFAFEREGINSALQLASQALAAQREVAGEEIARFSISRTSSLHSIRKLDLSLAQVRQRIAAQRAACARAKRDYELVLRLREKRLAEWQLEANREEETLATEAFLAKHTQRRFAVSSRPARSATGPASALPRRCEVPADAVPDG